MGVAVGSHTYSVSTAGQQIYHENVTIQNCKTNQTYNAAVRIWNWRNAVIKDNTFLGIQGLEDNKGYNYTCVLVRGAINPTITGNTFTKGGTKKYYAVVIRMLSSAEVEAAVNAGYADTMCEISPQNLVDLKNNTVGEGCHQKYRILNADGSDEKDYFNNILGADEGDTNDKGDDGSDG